MLFDKNDCIVFIGDSIGDYNRARPYGDQPAAWGTSYIYDVGTLLQCRYPDHRLHIINVCTGGEQSRHMAARWEQDVMRFKPDWVCLMAGINDAAREFDQPDRPQGWHSLQDYELVMESLITRTLPQVKGMVLMTPYYMEQNQEDRIRKTMDQYGAVVKKLGEKYHLLTIDTQKMWDDYFAQTEICPQAFCWDLIHPNGTGNKLLACTFLKAIGYEW